MPDTIGCVLTVIAGTVSAVVRMTGGTKFTPAAAETTARAGWNTQPGQPDQRAADQVSGPASPPAGAQAGPREQAAAVDAVLDASIASRTRLNAAIARVGDCTSIEQAVGDLRTVGTERQSQLDSVAAFDLSALPEGEQVRTLLSEALRHSLAADRGFVLWGQAVQDGGCDGGGRADYQADYREAQRQSRLASDAKARFLAVWNPVATRNGLRDRSSTEI